MELDHMLALAFFVGAGLFALWTIYITITGD